MTDRASELASKAATHVSEMRETGFTIIENAISERKLSRLSRDLSPHFSNAPFGTGHFYGEHTKRFGQLANRTAVAEDVMVNDLVTGIVEDILLPHAHCLQLNLTQGIEIHPGAPAQVPHRDQDMWHGPKGKIEYMVNVMWALTDFTRENGATRIWEGSHLTDPDEMLADDAAIYAEMPRGSVCMFLGSTLHSGGANRTNMPRRGIIVSYCLGWLKPWENQWLVYPPHVAKRFSPRLAAMVGYQQHLPSLGNVEGHCPSFLLSDESPRAFVDALRPEQQELMEQYNEQQFRNWNAA